MDKSLTEWRQKKPWQMDVVSLLFGNEDRKIICQNLPRFFVSRIVLFYLLGGGAIYNDYIMIRNIHGNLPSANILLQLCLEESILLLLGGWQGIYQPVSLNYHSAPSFPYCHLGHQWLVAFVFNPSGDLG